LGVDHQLKLQDNLFFKKICNTRPAAMSGLNVSGDFQFQQVVFSAVTRPTSKRKAKKLDASHLISWLFSLIGRKISIAK